jgi:hypothetical protein
MTLIGLRIFAQKYPRYVAGIDSFQAVWVGAHQICDFLSEGVDGLLPVDPHCAQ